MQKMNDKNILELKDISVSFDGETILDKLNLSIKDGEFELTKKAGLTLLQNTIR